MSDEHQQVADAFNNVDPNAEYQPEMEVEAPTEGAIDGHHVAPPENVIEEGEQAPEPEVPQYTPDYSFNVRGEQREFDEQLRPLVTDKESEEYVRSLMAKAYGLDSVQQSRDKYKSQFEELQPQYDRIMGDLQKANHYRRSNNLEMAFKTMGFTEQEVLQYAQQRLQYQEMTPEQQMAYDNQVNQQASQYDQQIMNQQQTSMYQQQIQQMKENEVNLVLTRPEITEFAQQFDQRMGKPGAFREEVWNRGRYHAMVNQIDIPAQQAVDEVLKMVGAGSFNEQPPAPQAQPAQQFQPTAPAGQPQPAANPPVIPKVTGSGASPTRAPIKSIQDIRNRRSDMFGS